MSEALFLKKPVLSIPLRAMVEQRFNAFYLEQLGYGKETRMDQLTPELLRSFEAQLPVFVKNIAKKRFLGNNMVFNLVDEFAETGTIPDLRRIGRDTTPVI